MALTDQTTRVRAGEELPVDIIDQYLKAHIPGLNGTPQISQFPGGASNLTYLLQYPDRDLVLRRPPFGHKAKSAHDMGREFRILNQLNEGFPYCPKAYVYCTDDSVIGAEFYVMERVNGIILRSELPPELSLDEGQTRALCESFIDKFVDLHNVDYQACGLGDLGKPEGYVKRQIEGWSERYERAITPDAPAWEAVKAWLKDKMPADHPKPGIIHVDYYAQRAGIEIPCIDFYYTYGLFRLAGIVQQIYYRFYHGQTQDQRFASFIHMNKLLEHKALQVIGQSTL